MSVSQVSISKYHNVLEMEFIQHQSYAVSKLGSDDVNHLTVSLLLESYHFVVLGHQSRHSLLHDLSILELYLIVTCKNITSNDLYEFLNFEIIYEGTEIKFINKNYFIIIIIL